MICSKIILADTNVFQGSPFPHHEQHAIDIVMYTIYYIEHLYIYKCSVYLSCDHLYYISKFDFLFRQFAMNKLKFPSERIVLYGWSIGGYTGTIDYYLTDYFIHR
jgi:hypothetical protein